ncbi:alpha/beta hydrolase [Actinophytocola sp.]|uniref:alpha/beta fold hydrolase n=1 Tax=Actinophytocola sp. TaxID=1872138 RepID=UPI0025C118AA|nr:alpha/beta hydrolase [Actinophytocola sp.]
MLLIHGGLWDGLDAARFWHAPGVVAGLRRRGIEVDAPDRLARPADWTADALRLTPTRPVAVVGASNGCSVAVRLALTMPASVTRLVLAWPATAVDDPPTRALFAELGAGPAVVDALLAGETLRGTTDTELATLGMPVRVLPARYTSGRRSTRCWS